MMLKSTHFRLRVRRNKMKPCFVYSKGYDFGFDALSLFHPFHGKKFSAAWDLFSEQHAEMSGLSCINPQQPVSNEQLLKIHTQAYLDTLNQSATIAKVVEINIARWIPVSLLQSRLMNPIRLACSGTLLAAETALEQQAIAMNFAGGYHHAFADHGEGFCFFADAALSILHCREKGLLSDTDKVLMIDLDAHRGNGFEAVTRNDQSVFIFDMYSFQVYPGLHPGDPDEFPYMIPLKSGMQGERYLKILQDELPTFLEQHKDAALVFYNAGNDILEGDPLGGLNVAYDDVVKRDRIVIDQLNQLETPSVIMTSGGYTQRSFQLIAEMASYLVRPGQNSGL